MLSGFVTSPDIFIKEVVCATECREQTNVRQAIIYK
jgi:hypothetical protein